VIQILPIIISFSIIPLLNRLKFNLSYTLLITAGILGIVSGIGFEAIMKAILIVFIDSTSQTTLLTIIMVSMLSGLMKHYKILYKIVDTVMLVIRNKKKILMIIPAMIGVLIVPGGALLSAPFVNNIGEEMKISPPRRAAINLVFRHMSLFILPYSTSLLIISATLPNISIFRLIVLNLFFVIPMVIVGYILYIKDIKLDKPLSKENKSKNLFKLAIFTSPIYICVIINAITGLPFYITLIVSIFIVYLLSDKKNFFKYAIRAINWNTILTVIAVLVMKEIILRMDNLLIVFNNLFYENSDQTSIMMIFFITSMFFGFTTGNQSTSLVILLPMISQLSVSIELVHIYTYFISISAFLGYFFSPIHLCQAFTLQVMDVSTIDLYKEYKFYAPITILILFCSMIILKLLLPYV